MLIGLQWEKEFTILLQENTFPSEVTHQVLQQRMRGPHSSSRDMGSSCCIFQSCVGARARRGQFPVCQDAGTRSTESSEETFSEFLQKIEREREKKYCS